MFGSHGKRRDIFCCDRDLCDRDLIIWDIDTTKERQVIQL